MRVFRFRGRPFAVAILLASGTTLAASTVAASALAAPPPVASRPGTAPTAAPTAPSTTSPTAVLDTRHFDERFRPQDDFYTYVNGRWLAGTPIPEDSSVWGAYEAMNERTLEVMREILEAPLPKDTPPDSDRAKLKRFYDTFLDEKTIAAQGLKPLDAEFARIAALKTPADLAVYFAHLDRIGVGSPIEIGIHQDNHNASRYLVDLMQGSLGLPDRDYYHDATAHYVELRRQYKALLGDLLTMAGSPDGAALAARIVALETRLAEVQWSAEENRNPDTTYNLVTIPELAGHTPAFDWPRFLAEAGMAGRVQEVTVSQPSYFDGLDRLLRTVPLADWQAYCRAILLIDTARFLPEPFVQRRFAFYGTALTGTPVLPPRWKRAVHAVGNTMGQAAGREYVAREFPPEARARAESMVREIIQAFRRSIDAAGWMSAGAKAEARAKLDRMAIKVGYPSRWRSYAALEVKSGDLIGNVFRAGSLDFDRQVALLGGPIDRDDWRMDPQDVNAYYNPEQNEIVFPAAMLQPPFFNPAADDAVNYGAIGALMGHEISHAFDDSGARFDATGNLRNWWSDRDREHFGRNARALVRQYAAYEVAPGVHIDGELTLGENIADNVGLTMAWRAYRATLRGEPARIDGFSGDQRFYLSFANAWRQSIREGEKLARTKNDPHALSIWRVRGTLANQDPFYVAFGIRPGDKGYVPPAKRTHFW